MPNNWEPTANGWQNTTSWLARSATRLPIGHVAAAAKAIRGRSGWVRWRRRSWEESISGLLILFEATGQSRILARHKDRLLLWERVVCCFVDIEMGHHQF